MTQLTLAKKLDSVHKNTTTSSRAMPSVLRARPSLSVRLIPPLLLLLLLLVEEPVVVLVTGSPLTKAATSEKGASASAAAIKAAVTDCDLRLAAEDEIAGAVAGV